MIFGIGTDIVEKERLNKIIERANGMDFEKKVLSKLEIDYCIKNNKKLADFCAKRFAAKEALFKAFGCGIGNSNILSQVSVLNDQKGKPFFTFSPEVEKYLSLKEVAVRLEDLIINVSMSDEKKYATAFVTIELK